MQNVSLLLQWLLVLASQWLLLMMCFLGYKYPIVGSRLEFYMKSSPQEPKIRVNFKLWISMMPNWDTTLNFETLYITLINFTDIKPMAEVITHCSRWWATCLMSVASCSSKNKNHKIIKKFHKIPLKLENVKFASIQCNKLFKTWKICN